MRKKTVRFNKKMLTKCSECGRPKLKDNRIVTDEQMALIDENLPPHKTERLNLK